MSLVEILLSICALQLIIIGWRVRHFGEKPSSKNKSYISEEEYTRLHSRLSKATDDANRLRSSIHHSTNVMSVVAMQSVLALHGVHVDYKDIPADIMFAAKRNPEELRRLLKYHYDIEIKGANTNE